MVGYEVRIATNGLNGYELFKKFDPDLVFTDIIMPEMDGVELVGKIRGIAPRIKVIYMSGFFGMRNIKERVREEIEKYGYMALSKPFKISYLLEVVNEYLAR